MRNTTEIDPICKMEVDPAATKWSSEYKGKKYYFCAPGCKKTFDQDPEKWASGGTQSHSGTCSGDN